MNTIVPLDFEGSGVRVVEKNSEPWFVAADVCRVLEHSNSRMAVDRLDADEKGVSTVDTPGGTQVMTTINESGLYLLILTSRKETAKRFRKWITSEVLPTIRKTGAYGAPAPTPDLNDPDTLRSLLLNYSSEVKRKNEIIAIQTPKVEALDRIASAYGSKSKPTL